MIVKNTSKYVELINGDNPRACVILLQTDASEDVGDVFREAQNAAMRVFSERGLKCIATREETTHEAAKKDFLSWLRLEIQQELFTPMAAIAMQRGREVKE
ncbi:MAG: hypothetical protein IJU03_00960 [Thermoguttaceae bacterium]|nr:hypothetical protein [Thermoguttaceae bacterium]